MHWRHCPCKDCELKRAIRAEQAVLAKELKREGFSIARIAYAIGSNHTTVSKLLKAGSHTQ